MSMMRARVRRHRWVDHPAAAVMKARVPGQWVDCPVAVVMEAREQGRCWIDHPAVAVMEARVQGRHWVDRPSVGQPKHVNEPAKINRRQSKLTGKVDIIKKRGGGRISVKMKRCVSAVFILVLLSAVSAHSDQNDDSTQTEASYDWNICGDIHKNLYPLPTRCAKPYPLARQRIIGWIEKAQIVHLHNIYRSSMHATNMMKMVWDESLAQSAQGLAMQCKSAHDNMKQRMEFHFPMVQIGQIVAQGYGSFKHLLITIHMENSRLSPYYPYVPGTHRHIPIYPNSRLFQVVSHQTSHVGCAEAYCPNLTHGRLRVCNYAPAKVPVKPAFEQGRPCAACPNHCDVHTNLCDCGRMLCINGWELDPSTCTCMCNGPRKGKYCQTFDCTKADPVNCKKHRPSHCGKEYRGLQDNSTCPHLCGLCGVQCRLGCQNGGVLNKTSCTCECKGNFQGRTCEQCQGLECKNGGVLNMTTCTCDCKGKFQGNTCEDCPQRDHPFCTGRYLQENCQTDDFMKLNCPNFCRTCRSKCKPCQNHGDIDSTTCECECKGVFQGAQCEICPQMEKDACHSLPRVYFSSSSIATRLQMQAQCPITFGDC
ncbi:hypothetical protein ACOMHN_001149 [Nucella lapillus]